VECTWEHIDRTLHCWNTTWQRRVAPVDCGPIRRDTPARPCPQHIYRMEPRLVTGLGLHTLRKQNRQTKSQAKRGGGRKYLGVRGKESELNQNPKISNVFTCLSQTTFPFSAAPCCGLCLLDLPFCPPALSHSPMPVLSLPKVSRLTIEQQREGGGKSTLNYQIDR